jgi:hypothetical protein
LSKFDIFVRLVAGWCGVRLLSQARNCSFLLNVQIGWGAIQWVQGFFPELKRSELEFSNSPPSSAEVKSGESCASALPVWIHVVHEDHWISTQQCRLSLNGHVCCLGVEVLLCYSQACPLFEEFLESGKYRDIQCTQRCKQSTHWSCMKVMNYWHILNFYGYYAVVSFLTLYNQCLKSLCSRSSRTALGHTQPPIQWIAVFASPLPSRVERLERQVDLSPPSSAEITNEWSRKRLRGVGRDGCNFDRKYAIRASLFQWLVGPCHHGMAHLQIADGGTDSNMEGRCENIE